MSITLMPTMEVSLGQGCGEDHRRGDREHWDWRKIAVVAKINFLVGVIDVTQPVLLYMLYVLTGVALGRGPSFVHDLWGRIRNT